MDIKPRHELLVPPVSKTFESHANDEEERRRLPPRWPHISGEKPPAPIKKAEEKQPRKKSASKDEGTTVIYTKTRKGEVILKTIPPQEGQSIDCEA